MRVPTSHNSSPGLHRSLTWSPCWKMVTSWPLPISSFARYSEIKACPPPFVVVIRHLSALTRTAKRLLLCGLQAEDAIPVPDRSCIAIFEALGGSSCALGVPRKLEKLAGKSWRRTCSTSE